MLASELLQHGVGRISEILSDMSVWMESYEYSRSSRCRAR